MRRLALAHLLSLALAIPAFASDGVLEINQTCATQTGCFTGDTAGFPVTINESGSYRLTSSLSGSFSSLSSAVSISADFVTIDLQGFAVRNETPGSGGIGITGNGSRISVANGSVVDFNHGISLPGDSAAVDRMRVRSIGTGGAIEVGARCRVTNSATVGGYLPAVSVGPYCLVEGNTFGGSSDGDALLAGGNSIIRGNTVIGTDDGINAPNCIVTGNSVTTVFGRPITVIGGGVVADNYASVSTSGGHFAIAATNALVSGNRVRGGSGISCSDCSVVGNVVSGSSGVALDATGGTGTTGYQGNQFNDNNGGNENPQVLGGIETGPNVCGGNLTCP